MNLRRGRRVLGDVRDIQHVATWELRRLRSDRSTWLILALAAALCLGLAWLKHSWGRPVVDGVQGENILILGTTRVGLPYLMIEGLFVLFGPLIPFVATEGVAHDFRERTHELLMATRISGVSYVWGRFVAVLIASLGLDVVLLASIFVVGPLLHAADPVYPTPDFALVVGTWTIAIVPGTIVLASASFVLGTLLPRVAPLIKVIPVVAWVALVFLSDAVDHGGTWFTTFNPTSYGIVRTQVDQFLATYQSDVVDVTDAASRAAIALRLQDTPPNLMPFVMPHLTLAIGSLLLVAWAATRFRRFRAELG